jgi:aminopeptidase N
MLHFLFSNPANGDDAAFLAMMKDFVARYANRAARTEDFWAVANEHFARTPIAQKFAIRDLGWFFRQWVYSTGLPSYQLDYEIKAQPDGSLFLSGVLRQDAVEDTWQMVLPLVLTFDGNQEARTTIRATGPSTVVELKLPMRPKKVELDPASWILSDKTTTRGR